VERDGDWRLTRQAFVEIWDDMGPFDMDLMASSVSVQKDMHGRPLPFFSRFHSPGSSGIDFLAQTIEPGGSYYCFPHKKMVLAAVNHCARMGPLTLALVVQDGDASWLARVHASVVRTLALKSPSVTSATGARIAGSFTVWMVRT